MKSTRSPVTLGGGSVLSSFNQSLYPSGVGKVDANGLSFKDASGVTYVVSYNATSGGYTIQSSVNQGYVGVAPFTGFTLTPLGSPPNLNNFTVCTPPTTYTPGRVDLPYWHCPGHCGRRPAGGYPGHSGPGGLQLQ